MVILMEEVSLAVVVPLRLGHLICDNPILATHMDITRLKMIADSRSLFTDAATKTCSSDFVSGGDEDCDGGDSEGEVGVMVSSVSRENKTGRVALLDVVSENESNWVVNDVTIHESEEDDSLSLEGDQILDSSCSLSVASDGSSICGDDLFTFEGASEMGTLSSVNVKIYAKDTDIGESSVEGEITSDPLPVAASHCEEMGDKSNSESPLQLPSEKGLTGRVLRSVFEVDYVPLWGFTSVCGRRPEMEDAVATVPRFLKIPIEMLIGDRVVDSMNKCLSHLTGHFFGVYDGHGGSQVANYCHGRLHCALAEELEIVMGNLSDGNMNVNCHELWRKAFTNCFLKVDAEVGGIANLEPVAPETVGSTAVVAIICSSHIIVANCGDSRVVLCRGKEPLPLSVDHKV
ncbi:protein-serine,threonine phosphatase [Sarracenia purpurea var. burkii]